jgi:plastocyanin
MMLRRSVLGSLALFGFGAAFHVAPASAQESGTGRSHSRVVARSAAPARIVVVAMREVTPRESYAYEPAEVVVQPGDRIRFRVLSGQTHSVAFEDEGMSSSARAAWNAALPARAADLTSPVLLHGDPAYEVIVPLVPPGRYRFYCLSHRAYNMEGVVRVTAR